MRKVYLDNAATTPIDEPVIEKMVEVMRMNYGNPSSTHSVGQEAKSLIEGVRRKIADYLRVQPGEIIFTSCGTESNNLIIKSCVSHLGVERIITSPLEHKCVAEAVRDAKTRKGVEVVYLRPDANGDILPEKVEEALKASDKKTLVSLMHANNEVGNLLDLEAVGKLCEQYGAYFHSDTVQTIGHLDLDFSKINIDFASCSAHKFHGPKGVGFAYVKKSSRLKPIILGGAQERELRAGTENVTGIVGLGVALDLCMTNLEEYARHIQQIKEYTKERLQARIPGVRFNGRSADSQRSLYTVLSALLPFKNPMIGLQLDMKGVAISQGSACSSGAAKPSMVMMMLLDDNDLEETTPLRISFCHHTTKEDIDYFVEALVEISSSSLIEKNNA
ncbi:cysteine desulfurase family protein [Bergeyella sp. RCAD1439]|uniref:cysteine desulfurase family protein n=1 Tax=Bergeyella anatis TaxID=3113737 RepID=UPI002E17A06C|nr:cysteine desulfurase family protein [Bergeyella sp. RCAD1439]